MTAFACFAVWRAVPAGVGWKSGTAMTIGPPCRSRTGDAVDAANAAIAVAVQVGRSASRSRPTT